MYCIEVIKRMNQERLKIETAKAESEGDIALNQRLDAIDDNSEL